MSGNGDLAIEMQIISKARKNKRYAMKPADSVAFMLRQNSDEKGELIIAPKITSPGTSGWQMVPNNIKNMDAELSDLPRSFSEGYSRFAIGQAIPYRRDGKEYSVVVSSDVSLGTGKYGTERALWSYPLQPLVIPAFLIDSVVMTGVFLHWLITVGDK